MFQNSIFRLIKTLKKIFECDKKQRGRRLYAPMRGGCWKGEDEGVVHVKRRVG